MSGSPMQVFNPPGDGPLRAFWLGLFLVLGSFAFKHVLFSWGLANASAGIDPVRQQLEARISTAEIRSDIDKYSQLAYKSEDNDERQKYRDKASELEKSLDKKRESLAKDSNEAENSAMAGSSAALGKFQWLLSLKLLFDLAKLGGIALILFSTLHIIIDDKFGTPLKVYATIAGCVVLFASTVGSLWTMMT